MSSPFLDGFAKEANVGTFLRNKGRAAMRGAGHILGGGRATGKALGEVAGAAASLPLAAGAAVAGKTVEVAGKTVRNVANKAEGMWAGRRMGGAGLRRALRTGAGARAPHGPSATLVGGGSSTTSSAGTSIVHDAQSAIERSRNRWRTGAMVAGGGAAVYGMASGARKARPEAEN